MTIEALKLGIIDKIRSLGNEDVHKLKKLEATLKEMWPEEDIIKKLSKPIRKKIDIEELKREQNFKPINKKEFFQKIDELNIEEPLEELIRMI